MAWAWIDFRVSSEAQTLLEGDQRNLSSYEKVMDILREDVVILISLRCDDVFAPAGMNAIRRIS